jgi:uncharacterized protein DUF3313
MRQSNCLALMLLIVFAAGCHSRPPLQRSGFISDYSRLVAVNDHTARYISPRAKDYSMVIIDPVESRLPAGALSDEERAEALRYMHDACKRAFSEAGYSIVDETGVGVARVEMALIDIAASTWWKKIHPGMRLSGAGTGGAAMEAEVTDSITGEQIAAVVQSGSGNQFNLTSFSTLADVKSAIDKWAEITARQLREIKAGAPASKSDPTPSPAGAA